MVASPVPHSRTLRIVAQDPGVKADGGILTARIEVPAENIAAGPWGYRVQVIDYDATSRVLYKPLAPVAYRDSSGSHVDPFEKASDRTILSDPRFHAQNVYAIAMRTLARFESALGRRVSWSFATHQLKIAPHAFGDANAFYSTDDEALLFGYFRGREGDVFTCLSHDVVAHETTHALLDGLRERYIDPSSPDQAAFHEGFADVVALLSVFSLKGVVEAALSRGAPKGTTLVKHGNAKGQARPTLREKQLTPKTLQKSVLMSLADQMGEELSGIRGRPLRQSAALRPSPAYYLDDPEFVEPHRRGEILVAAMMNAFLKVWTARLGALDPTGTGLLDRARVVEEGAKAADHLLTVAIRALDFCMPVHMEFGDYLSGLLTADHETCPDDSLYHYRRHLRASFKEYGIMPLSSRTGAEPGIWQPPESDPSYDRTHFDSLVRDKDEMFRFIWENRKLLGVTDDVYTRVLSVRPCMRIAPDGFALRETVAEYMQLIKLEAKELSRFHVKMPRGMPRDSKIVLQGGGTLVFDEFGRLKFNINNRLNDAQRQSRRLKYMWQAGFIRSGGAQKKHSFSELHRLRTLNGTLRCEEGWR